MKRLLLILLLTFTTIASASDEALSFPFTLDSVKNWKYISDQVMGGVSEGSVSLEQDGDMAFARLTGDVSTRNNGGFIQLRSAVSLFNKPKMFQSIHDADKEGKELQGVRLNVRGNGETYHVMIRTYFNWSPSDYYSHTFETSPDWKQVDLPFSEFKRSKSRSTALDIDEIRDFGIVAFGRDFKSDVSISKIDFY